jgi:hypothetical protein
VISVPPLPLTREHGSWAVLAVPLIVGTTAGDGATWKHALLALAALLGFLAYVPVQIMLTSRSGRRVDTPEIHSALWWLWVLSPPALGALAWLVAGGEEHLLVWAGIAGASFMVHAWLFRLKGKSSWGDLAASIGLSAGAPAALMMDGTSTWAEALSVWLLVSLFFGCTVVYVHMKIRAVAAKLVGGSILSRLRFGWVTVAYHVAVIGLVIALVAAGRTNALAVAAYCPMLVHAVVGTIRRAGRVRFHRLGFALLGHSLVFAALIALAWKGGL